MCLNYIRRLHEWSGCRDVYERNFGNSTKTEDVMCSCTFKSLKLVFISLTFSFVLNSFALFSIRFLNLFSILSSFINYSYPQGDGCFKCGESGHFSRECPQGLYHQSSGHIFSYLALSLLVSSVQCQQFVMVNNRVQCVICRCTLKTNSLLMRIDKLNYWVRPHFPIFCNSGHLVVQIALPSIVHHI